MASKKPVLGPGFSLIAEFQSAATNLATMHSAKAAADYSEKDTLEALAGMNVGNSLFVTPDDIPQEIKEQLTRTSLDAHLKRVQSEQISEAIIREVMSQEKIAKSAYIGKKVTFFAENKSFQPFESVWQNKTTGQLSTSKINNHKVSGVVEDLSFDKNILVLKPTNFSRLFTPQRKYFLVQVINWSTLRPAVSIQD